MSMRAMDLTLPRSLSRARSVAWAFSPTMSSEHLILLCSLFFTVFSNLAFWNAAIEHPLQQWRLALSLFVVVITLHALLLGLVVNRWTAKPLLTVLLPVSYTHLDVYKRQFWYYAQVMMTLWLPGALLLPWLLPAWWRRLRRGDPRFWLLLGWTALVLLFFSASPGKREVYIFPMLPALCVVAAPLLPALMQRIAVRRTLFAYLLVLGSIACVLSMTALTGSTTWAHRLADQRGISDDTMQVFLFWLLGFGVAVFAILSLSLIHICSITRFKPQTTSRPSNRTTATVPPATARVMLPSTPSNPLRSKAMATGRPCIWSSSTTLFTLSRDWSSCSPGPSSCRKEGTGGVPSAPNSRSVSVSCQRYSGLFCTRWPKSVSYTHLDVYKRQV